MKEPQESFTTATARRIIEKIDAKRLCDEIKSRPRCRCGGIKLEVTDEVFECMSCGIID
ncbi:hypothetical protein ES708_29304 [subsurface metagenome]